MRIHILLLALSDITTWINDFLQNQTNRNWIIAIILGLLLLIIIWVGIRLARGAARRAPAPHPRKVTARQTRPRPAVAATASAWQLVDPSGKAISLQPLPFAIGREANNQLVLNDPAIAPRHARIQHDPAWGCLVVEDLDSPIGIRIDGKPTHKNLFQPGMRLTIGQYTFTLVQK